MKTVEEFKEYCKEYVKNALHESYPTWDLSNGHTIYFLKGFKKPHVVSSEPIVGAKYVEFFGYEKSLDWDIAFDILRTDGAF